MTISPEYLKAFALGLVLWGLVTVPIAICVAKASKRREDLHRRLSGGVRLNVSAVDEATFRTHLAAFRRALRIGRLS